MEAQINNISDLLFFTALDAVNEEAFEEAAHTILLLVLLFDVNDDIFQKLFNKISELPPDLLIRFSNELTARIVWGGRINNNYVFSRREQNQQDDRLNKFISLFFEYLLLEEKRCEIRGGSDKSARLFESIFITTLFETAFKLVQVKKKTKKKKYYFYSFILKLIVEPHIVLPIKLLKSMHFIYSKLRIKG